MTPALRPNMGEAIYGAHDAKGIVRVGDADADVRAHFVTLCPVLLKLNQQLQNVFEDEVEQHNDSRDQAPASDDETKHNSTC